MVYQAAGALRLRMIVQLAVTPFQLAVLFVSTRGSLVDAAFGTAASAAIEFLPSQLVVNRICGSTMRIVGVALLPSAAVTVSTLAAALGTVVLLRTVPGSLPLFAATGSGVLGWIVGLIAVQHPLGAELALLLRDMRRRFALPGLT